MSSTPVQRLCWSGLLLSVFYISGCAIFISLERDAELRSYAENRKLYQDMQKLYSFRHCEDRAFRNLTFCQDQAEFSRSLKDYFNQHGNSIEDKEQWTVLGTVFFLTHLGTTIGYGSSHPRTPLGQVATIIFGLAGIPIMGYTLLQVARLNMRASSLVLVKLIGVQVNSVRRQVLLLWTLLVLFLFGGALVYWLLEPWNYLQSLYFCFVTLSTVGFGDFLPSSPVSKAFSIVYMISGLGVCASIIAVLTGMVAESHESVDAFVTKRLGPSLSSGRLMSTLSRSCPECPCAEGGAGRSAQA